MKKPNSEESKPVLEPPAHLSDRSKELWREIVQRPGRLPEHLALLQVALECLDRVADARAIIARDGMTFTSGRTNTVHVHPAVKLENASMVVFTRIWLQLGLAHWWPMVHTETRGIFSGARSR